MSKKPRAKQSGPPEGLSDEAQALYRRIAREWSIRDGAGLITLLTACQCLDRLRQAQGILTADGIVLEDRFGQKKLHPAVETEHKARSGMLVALKALNLDFESLEIGEDAAKA